MRPQGFGRRQRRHSSPGRSSQPSKAKRDPFAAARAAHVWPRPGAAASVRFPVEQRCRQRPGSADIVEKLRSALRNPRQHTTLRACNERQVLCLAWPIAAGDFFNNIRPIVLKKSALLAESQHWVGRARLPSSERRLRDRDQLGELAEVLGGGGEEELVLGTIRAPQAQAVQL